MVGFLVMMVCFNKDRFFLERCCFLVSADVCCFDAVWLFASII